MFVISILLVASVCVASGFLIAFLWASRNGQYDDINTPALRMLFDDKPSRASDHPG